MVRFIRLLAAVALAAALASAANAQGVPLQEGSAGDRPSAVRAVASEARDAA